MVAPLVAHVDESTSLPSPALSCFSSTDSLSQLASSSRYPVRPPLFDRSNSSSSLQSSTSTAYSLDSQLDDDVEPQELLLSSPPALCSLPRLNFYSHTPSSSSSTSSLSTGGSRSKLVTPSSSTGSSPALSRAPLRGSTHQPTVLPSVLSTSGIGRKVSGPAAIKTVSGYSSAKSSSSHVRRHTSPSSLAAGGNFLGRLLSRATSGSHGNTKGIAKSSSAGPGPVKIAAPNDSTSFIY